MFTEARSSGSLARTGQAKPPRSNAHKDSGDQPRGRSRYSGTTRLQNGERSPGRVGSQLQDSNLPDRLRVREAVWLFADSRSDGDRVIEDWKLDDIAKKPFGSLSGGQQQRLFLALALLNQPEVVFLDELTQGLDPDARRTVWRLIERVRDSGTTVVLVTHFTEEAEALCDRVAVMADGRLVARRYADGTRRST